jgi:uncharacterized protein (DUF1778 family)
MTTMTTASITKPRRETLNLRIPVAERNLIDRAALSAGKTRTDFILEAARRSAEETLLDRALMVVSPEAYGEFLARLDQPARPSEALRRTMRAKAPWHKD